MCKGCRNNLLKSVRMPRTLYGNVMKFPMPMPIPKHAEVGKSSTDLNYLSFADTHKLPFTNRHSRLKLRALLRGKRRLLFPADFHRQDLHVVQTSRSSKINPASRLVSQPKFAALWSARVATSFVAFTLCSHYVT